MEALEKFFEENTTTSDYSVKQNLGPMVQAFKNYDFKFQDKNAGKKATFVFRNAEGKFRNVVLSNKLDALYRAGGITKLQLIGCDVVILDLINPDTKAVIAENAFRLQAPASGFSKMADLTAESYVDAIAGF